MKSFLADPRCLSKTELEETLMALLHHAAGKHLNNGHDLFATVSGAEEFLDAYVAYSAEHFKGRKPL